MDQHPPRAKSPAAKPVNAGAERDPPSRVALRQALIEGEDSGPAGPLDMEAIKRRARQEARLSPDRPPAPSAER
jgi:hypothetical protein